ncbi:MAG: glutamine synthetase [Pseudomonadales bacterium]|nr:glutamine synthetase [Pseudomonadales bacterium]
MIENELDVPPVLGDAYSDTSLDRVPETLDEAIDLFEQSEITNSYLGEDFVRFYAHSRRLETVSFQAAIADGVTRMKSQPGSWHATLKWFRTRSYG